ncbi:MAG: hypothetical protein RBU37_07775 [Myxococcota bacterium]|nr:hypothetical protein [Myxococcota bacterium]
MKLSPSCSSARCRPAPLCFLLASSLAFCLALPSRAEAQGTHFIAEAELGVAMPMGAELDEAGMGIGATFGFGGKVPGTFVRGYLLAQANFSQFSINRCGVQGLDRHVTDTALGARMLIPLFDSIRVFGDVLLASAWVSSQELDSAGMRYWIEDADPRMAAIFSAGIQFRPMSLLSLGARADFLTLLDQTELPEGEVEGRVSFLGSVSLHF